jgi:hypothetical protein
MYPTVCFKPFCNKNTKKLNDRPPSKLKLSSSPIVITTTSTPDKVNIIETAISQTFTNKTNDIDGNYTFDIINNINYLVVDKKLNYIKIVPILANFMSPKDWKYQSENSKMSINVSIVKFRKDTNNEMKDIETYPLGGCICENPFVFNQSFNYNSYLKNVYIPVNVNDYFRVFVRYSLFIGSLYRGQSGPEGYTYMIKDRNVACESNFNFEVYTYDIKFPTISQPHLIKSINPNLKFSICLTNDKLNIFSVGVNDLYYLTKDDGDDKIYIKVSHTGLFKLSPKKFKIGVHQIELDNPYTFCSIDILLKQIKTNKTESVYSLGGFVGNSIPWGKSIDMLTKLNPVYIPVERDDKLYVYIKYSFTGNISYYDYTQHFLPEDSYYMGKVETLDNKVSFDFDFDITSYN